MALRALVWVVPLAAAVLACAEEPKTAKEAKASVGAPVQFTFGTTEGELVDSSGTRGRTTALLFATTFDMASQVQAKRLDQVARTHRPRANAAVVILETPQYAVFAETFRTTLGLSVPVALADPATLAGQGPFGEIPGVPLLIVLDRDGRPVVRRIGMLEPREIERVLSQADSAARLP